VGNCNQSYSFKAEISAFTETHRKLTENAHRWNMLNQGAPVAVREELGVKSDDRPKIYRDDVETQACLDITT
jgi:hypothetical protein